MDFGRMMTAMVTPFDHNQHIDWEQTEKLVDFLIEEQRNDCLVVCGTTGESPTLSDDEMMELFRKTVQFANGRCKIIAGTGSNNTFHAMKMTKEAEKTGVDGVLLVAPYYSRPNQQGLYEHFKTIAESTNLPIMIYNIPKRSGVTIEAETIIQLSEISNIVATKEAHNDLDLISQVIAKTDDDFKVYSGDDGLTLPMLSIGAYGVVSVAGHIIGKEIKAMLSAYVNGEIKKATQLHHKCHAIFTGLFLCPSPSLTKYALGLLDMDVGGMRLPITEASDDAKQIIKDLIEKK
ncbi:4-hydroxy-tetrahydrodipicolinate synthase [Chengkuizengella sp. 2205SS18-9]|uniref:4-hydroxy-tetrahydrodipicolinate synthase n=1 Tax=Chengkuizengella axinellae TaxID=3064388 RepID=A0ABT9IVY1_9BACL|nr:4-hydroxy-tetrahydrodipicolinate synthase [Chengkuizengella sp. 2205SS18-9]MDP5273498.1 4-hydroxy-tetrahydrodipicolinate synthase [Chengkuizengella sp. 2205SS18-9]